MIGILWWILRWINLYYLDFKTCKLEYLRNLVIHSLKNSSLKVSFIPDSFSELSFESLTNLIEEIFIFKPNYLTWFKTYLNNAMVKTMSSRRETNPPAIYDEMWDFSFIILSHSGFEFAISLNGTACLTSWKNKKKIKKLFHF